MKRYQIKNTFRKAGRPISYRTIDGGVVSVAPRQLRFVRNMSDEALASVLNNGSLHPIFKAVAEKERSNLVCDPLAGNWCIVPDDITVFPNVKSVVASLIAQLS